MPKERGNLRDILAGEEPGILARILHELTGEGEGEWGEKCVSKLLKRRIKEGKQYRNVYVPYGERTAELDLVLVLRDRLWVIESKAYGGRITGSAEDLNWTQELGRVKSTFYNPVKQNANHVRRLSEALKIPESRLYSAIVFENRADLKGVKGKRGRNYIVCSRRDFLAAMEKGLEKEGKPFTKEEREEIEGKLKAWQDGTRRAKHIQQVKELLDCGTCPECGRKLMVRTGCYGEFIGCTGYPECRYTRKAEQKDKGAAKTAGKTITQVGKVPKTDKKGGQGREKA